MTDDLAMKALTGTPADAGAAGAGGGLRHGAVLRRRVRADGGAAGALPAADRRGGGAAGGRARPGRAAALPLDADALAAERDRLLA